jgi:F-type H+-transporting ATPase subunit epsilon
MKTIKVKIITPQKVVREEEATSVTAPTMDGEVSILPHHAKFLSALTDGVVVLHKGEKEEYLAVGGGYVETDGKEVKLLVSRAHGQDEIDETLTKKALEEAKKVMTSVKDDTQRHEATLIMRRSVVDLKLLRKRRTRAL